MAAVRCGNLGCECACHRQKVRRAPVFWTSEQDAVLTTALERGVHVRVVAADLGVTVGALRWRLRTLNRSTREGWRSCDEVTRALGVSWRQLRRWRVDGLLDVTTHGTRWKRVRESDLDAFVKAQAGLLFDPSGVTDPALRRLAETSAIVNRRRAG